ncbi:DNA (cytosine-5-)-methyltransferase [Oryzisolibacter sp. LB2S]|uniref:DNA cytosine methyltransferase n=1 Tax=Alicycliphilus soli TaxID=3228789 RepID=UPI00345A67CE
MPRTPVPIIDLFAGPGGLGEGFASLKGHDKQPFFEIGLSIEKTEVAHRTLMLRAAFRRLRGTKDVRHYYSFVRGEIDEATFRSIPAVAQAFKHAAREARCLELGKSDEAGIDAEIRTALNGQKTWVLIGGPPCQAYSLAGRARRANDKDFHKDEKHFLYKEYLRIIRVHKPTIFVMENVKGLLSSSHSGSPMFERILADLASPAEGLEYEIRSFTKRGNSDTLEPEDYLIHSERYGVPQSRHRVILFGVLKGSGAPQHQLLVPVSTPVTVGDAIGNLPKIRSKLSRGDSELTWRNAVHAAPSYIHGWGFAIESAVIERMQTLIAETTSSDTGGAFMAQHEGKQGNPSELEQWLHDRNLGGVCQHEARAHMASDLARYFFAATFAELQKYSPRLDVFPPKLLPDHHNLRGDNKADAIPFKDRFRVQCKNDPATTVVAHIAKDGHYYIHYDPRQCRSLTVREAARLQTFPDNYYFAGNRTEQYTQVGNAVPPLLAHKLARIVRSLLNEMNRNRRRQVKGRMNHKPRMTTGCSPSGQQAQVPLFAEAS